jgi:tetratricopeptide (TPR) repeat protein
MPPEAIDVRHRTVALYGRFPPGVRERLRGRITDRGGGVARDLTLRSDYLVVGSLAASLIDSGALASRLHAARARGVPILGERAFAAALDDEPPPAATLPLQTAMAQTALTRDDADVFAAFDLVAIVDDRCRFADAGTLRTAADLVERGRSLADVVRILAHARDLAPRGRHKIVLTPAGEAALQWEHGLTSLEGQGLLPLDEDHPTLDDLFEQAALAEAEGDLDRAAQLYDQCSRADRSDAIAAYNLGNIRLAQDAHDEAVLAYQRALSRDAQFVEARYNLALTLEALDKMEAAAVELDRVLADDPKHADAVFNLAQLKMKAGDIVGAKALYERYLDLDPPEDWAAMARRAIIYCAARLSA